MDTAVINLKVGTGVKAEAQRVAEEMGLSLSALIKGFLHQLVRTKTVAFTLREEPSEYLLSTLKESRRDIEAGRISPAFGETDKAVDWLRRESKKYAGKV
jgi:addiction module RelB/DinJ family antitoxin